MWIYYHPRPKRLKNKQNFGVVEPRACKVRVSGDDIDMCWCADFYLFLPAKRWTFGRTCIDGEEFQWTKEDLASVGSAACRMDLKGLKERMQYRVT